MTRPTVRLRLTAAFGTLFLLGGALLVALNFVLVRSNLPPDADQYVTFAPAPRDRWDRSPEALPGYAFSTFPTSASVTGLPTVTGYDVSPTATAGLGAAPADVVQLAGNLDGDFEAALGVVQGITTGLRDRTLRELVMQSGIALAVTALASVALGWIIAGRTLRPLQRITTTAQRLSEQNLHERIALEGPHDELKELADTFDAMLGRLDSAFDEQRRFAANVAHELRTPLSVASTLIDVTLARPGATADDLRAVFQEIRRSHERAEHLIASLMLLARAERGLRASEHVDLRDAAASSLAQLAPGSGPAITIERSLRSAPVEGDPTLLERLAGNLVENAARYNQPDGWIRVTTCKSEGLAVLIVENSGPAIPADRLPMLFEPFRRAGEDRTAREGAGLGLSIVEAITRAHGGVVSATARSEGGLRVEVSLPLRPQQGAPGPSPAAIAVAQPQGA